jgi:hypothetical protein
MFRLLEYYGRWQTVKGGVQQLPGWARFMIAVAAIPGVVLIALSILAFLVSILALLILTVPTLRLVRLISRLTGGSKGQQTVQRAGTGGFGPVPDGMEEVVEQQSPREHPAATTVVESPVEGEPRPARRQIEVKIVE